MYDLPDFIDRAEDQVKNDQCYPDQTSNNRRYYEALPVGHPFIPDIREVDIPPQDQADESQYAVY